MSISCGIFYSNNIVTIGYISNIPADPTHNLFLYKCNNKMILLFGLSENCVPVSKFGER